MKSKRKVISKPRYFIFGLLFLSFILLFSAAMYFMKQRLMLKTSPLDRASELKKCLPMSDMESKATCERLLKEITTFEECQTAGFPIMESYPSRCRTVDGRTFVQSLPTPLVSEIPIDLVGHLTCLPHKNKSGPTTLECAYGLQTPEDNYYALDATSLLPNALSLYQFTESIRVRGILVPIEAISSNQWQKYDIVGIIKVENIEKFKK